MSDKDYEVGHGKPPRHSQWQPGQSGNPKGRPKGAKGWRELSEAEGRKRHRVTINGKQVWLTQREITVKKLWHKAMQGDIKAYQTVMALEEPRPLKSSPDFDPSIPYEVTLVFEEEQIREMERAELAERVEAARLAGRETTEFGEPVPPLLSPPDR